MYNMPFVNNVPQAIQLLCFAATRGDLKTSPGSMKNYLCFVELTTIYRVFVLI